MSAAWPAQKFNSQRL